MESIGPDGVLSKVFLSKGTDPNGILGKVLLPKFVPAHGRVPPDPLIGGTQDIITCLLARVSMRVHGAHDAYRFNAKRLPTNFFTSSHYRGFVLWVWGETERLYREEFANAAESPLHVCEMMLIQHVVSRTLHRVDEQVRGSSQVADPMTYYQFERMIVDAFNQTIALLGGHNRESMVADSALPDHPRLRALAAAWRRLVSEGEPRPSQRQIAASLGVAEKTVRDWLKAAEIDWEIFESAMMTERVTVSP